jgi:hypothetical protein
MQVFGKVPRLAQHLNFAESSFQPKVQTSKDCRIGRLGQRLQLRFSYPEHARSEDMRNIKIQPTKCEINASTFTTPRVAMIPDATGACIIFQG